MDDWRLKARTVVRLKKERNMFVSSYCAYNFTGKLRRVKVRGPSAYGLHLRCKQL